MKTLMFSKKVVEHKMDKSKINETTQSRRRFVKRTAVGAALVSLPVKSVWANGITNSIVASGHGSDWANGGTLRLQGPDYWEREISNYPDAQETFFGIFNERAFKAEMTEDVQRKGNGSIKKVGQNRSLADILLLKKGNQSPHTAPEFAGPNDYNRLLISMYLNAKYGKTSEYSEVYYPVANGRPFRNEIDYAERLVKLTYDYPASSALELAEVIANPSNYQSL